VEWLIKAWHNLSTAKLLYNVEHYTDIIAIELHYSIEKLLKTFISYENKKIPKTHDLIELYKLISHYIQYDEEELLILKLATKYHMEESYPQFERMMPSRIEVLKVLEFNKKLFDDVCRMLSIDKEEIIKL